MPLLVALALLIAAQLWPSLSSTTPASGRRLPRYPTTPPSGFVVLHKDDHSSYQYLDSIEGLQRLISWYGDKVANVRPGIDVDVTPGGRDKVTGARFVWMAHWNDSLGHYFAGPFLRSVWRIATATPTQVRMLRSTHADSRGARIPTLHQGITWVSHHDRAIVLCVELKAVFSVDDLTRIRKYAEERGVTLICMRIQGWPTRSLSIAALQNAHRAGLWTMLLGRGGVTPAAYFGVDPVTGERWLDYGKGSRRQYSKAPAGFRRVGLGAGDATAWGAGCHRSSLAAAKRAIAKAHAASRWS